MSDTVFNVPGVAPGYNPENDKVMIHNLSQPAGSSTQMIGILELLNKFVLTDGKVKIRLIDNGEEVVPFIAGAGIFTVAFNEIVIFKSQFAKNDFDVVDGYYLHVFTKGKGKYRRVGVTDPTATDVVEADFIQIYKSPYGDETFPGYISSGAFDGILGYSSSTDFEFPNHQTATKYFERIFKDGLSKLDLPIIDFTWGGQGVDEQRVVNPTRSWIDLDGVPQSVTYGVDPVYPLAFTKLGMKVNNWASFQQFITLGGEISLLIYRRRYKKRSFSLVSGATQTPLKPVRWALNKKAPNFGGVTQLSVVSEMDYYDIHPEAFLKGMPFQERSYIDGNTSSLTSNKVRREWLGFAFKFTMPGGSSPYITPIIKTLGITKIRSTRSEHWPSIDISPDTDVKYDIIGYQYQ